jgi:hypothetical protein
MTLAEWAEANGTLPHEFNKPGYDKLMTVYDRQFPDRPGLWRLSDYVVTSVTGGTIWLAPRRKNV